MTTYTSVFGTDAVPPTDYSYAAVALSANTTFEWPQLATSANLIADLMEVTPSGAGLVLTMPAANQVSTAMPVLMRNMGGSTFTVNGSTGSQICTIAAGVSKLIYITSNATAAGTWASITYGTGSSASDSAALAGYGTKATATTLSTKMAVTTKSANWTVATTDRAQLFTVTSGTVTCTLPGAATAGDDFFFAVRNSGTGTVTIDGDGSETIDGATTKALAPDESAWVVCSGTAWYTVGYGRSTQFQFTKLVKSVTAGGTFTLTSAEASNKLLQFTGSPTTDITIIVPSVVAVYYTQNSYSGTNTLTVKTASGASVVTTTNDRNILYCDGTDVVQAQTSAVATSNLAGGSAGVIPYQTALDTTGFTAVGGAGGILLSGGTGSPTWLTAGATTEVLVGGGLGSAPVFTTATGSGAPVRATSPTLVTPTLGVASATSLNKMAITAPATSSTLAVADGKTFTASNTLTLSGTDGSTLSIGTGGTLGTAAYTAATAYQPADADLTTWAGITPGTGVGTALAVNVGSAGAIVANGGALGTPASGNLANCTGYVGTSALVTTGALNSGSITSGFGSIDIGTDALTAGAGSFTTLSATATSGSAGGFTTTSSGTSVFSVKNISTGGYSAIDFQDSTGTSKLGIGWGNSTAVAAYQGTAYLWSANGIKFSASSFGTADMTLDASGNLSVSGVVSVDVDTDAVPYIVKLRNASAGTSAGTGFSIGNNAGANGLNLRMYGTTHATLARAAHVFNEQNGPLVFGTNGNEVGRFDSSGYLTVGAGGTGNTFTRIILSGSNASGYGPYHDYQANGATFASVGDYAAFVGGATHQLLCRNTSGGVYLSGGGATSWTAVSDEREKNILENIADALSKVNSLRAVIGAYKSDAESTRKAFLIAQDVQAVLPEAVSETNGVLGLAYTDTIPLLVAALKELSAKNDTLEARLAALEAK